MKAKIYMLALILCSVNLFAQTAAKTAGVNTVSKRLHYTKYFYYTGTIPTISDSTLYTYPAGVGDETGSAASEENQVYWNDAQQVFENGLKNLRQFNGNGKITSRTYVEWDGSQWLNTKKTEWAYDGSGNQIQNSNFTWRNNAWLEYTRSVSGYNLQNKIVVSIYQDTSSGALADKSKYSYAYDGNNRMQYYTQQNMVLGNWENYYKQSYFYTGLSANSDSIISSYWNTSAWGLSVKNAYIYNVNGDLQERWRYNYNVNTWVNYTKETYTYTGNLVLSQYDFFTWLNSAWQNTSRVNYLYSGTGKEIQSTYKAYNNTTQQLEFTAQYATTYTIEDFKNVYSAYTYIANVFKPTTRKEYYYEQYQPTAIDEVKSDSRLLTFPNPFSVNTIIQFNAATSGETSIGIFDVSGRQVFSEKFFATAGENSFLWKATDANGKTLPAGLYVVKISSGEQSSFAKVIKQ